MRKKNGENMTFPSRPKEGQKEQTMGIAEILNSGKQQVTPPRKLPGPSEGR